MLLALLLSPAYVHASDPVSVAYSVLSEIEETRTRVEPILVNADAYGTGASRFYTGSVVYTVHHYYPESGYRLFRPANVSGLLYEVDGLPLIHFTISLNTTVGWWTTVLTLTNEREPDKYIFLRVQVRREHTYIGNILLSHTKVVVTWGLVVFNGTSWSLRGELAWLNFPWGNESLRFTVVPCFYEHNSQLIYGFAVRMEQGSIRYVHTATGDIAYTFLPLSNRTSADLAQNLLSLYKWYVFIGSGAAYVTRTMIYSDGVISSRNVSSVTVNYTVQDPLVLAVRVNAEKLMELYASGMLPVYDSPRFLVEQEDVATPRIIHVLAMGLMPVGVALVLGYFMRKFRVSSTVVGLIVVCVSSILMYTLFSNAAFIVLLLISSLMIVSLKWGEA
ncbi:MAG: hypothetical protein QXY39_05930 [Thermofilaceae archaeon]